jgi:hypothetical protein
MIKGIEIDCLLRCNEAPGTEFERQSKTRTLIKIVCMGDIYIYIYDNVHVILINT